MKASTDRVVILFFALTLALSFVFGVFLASNRVTDPFLYYDVAFVRSVQGESRVDIPSTGPFSSLRFVPGREMLMAQFVGVMGISPQQLQFLPIGIIIVAMTLYLLAWKLLKSPGVACLLTLYLTLNLSHASALYSVFAYALALPLFVAFVIFCLRSFEDKQPFELVLLVILFVATHLIHYTVATWLMFFLLGANCVIWLVQKSKFRLTAFSLRPAYYMSLVTVVIFFFFNQTIYQSFLPLIGLETFDSAVQRFFAYLSVNQRDTQSPYLFSRATLLGLISTASLVVILMPVIIGVLSDVGGLVAKKLNKRATSLQLSFIMGIVILGIADVMSYSIRGSISTKTLSILFPLVALMYTQRLRRQGLVYVVAGALIATSIVKIMLFYANSYTIGPHTLGSDYDQIRSSSNWLQSHIPEERFSMLADLNLYGLYLVDMTTSQNAPILQGYTVERYGRVVGNSQYLTSWNDAPDIVAIDMQSSQPTIGFIWLLFDPLRDYRTSIETNSQLNLIYDDGAIWLTKPIKE